MRYIKKSIEDVTLETIRPLLKQIPDSLMYKVYPLVYDELIKKKLIKEPEKAMELSIKEEIGTYPDLKKAFDTLPWMHKDN